MEEVFAEADEIFQETLETGYQEHVHLETNGAIVTMENGKFVHMLPNGDITDSQELDGKIPENHDLGWWQVGCTCYKNFLKSAHTKPVKTWMVENGYAK